MVACVWNGDLLKINRQTIFKNRLLWEEFWVHSKCERKGQRLPMHSPPWHRHRPAPPFHRHPHTHRDAFVGMGECTETRHYHLKSTVHVRVYSWCGPPCGFQQMYDDMCPARQYHTQQSHGPKLPGICLFVPPWPNAWHPQPLILLLCP